MIKKSNPELKQAYDGRLATLTIDHVVPDDAGEYTCAAKNAAGEVRCSCQLTVRGQSVLLLVQSSVYCLSDVMFCVLRMCFFEILFSHFATVKQPMNSAI